jgi:hypothetical protein
MSRHRTADKQFFEPERADALKCASLRARCAIVTEDWQKAQAARR